MIISIAVTPITYIWKDTVWMVYALSMIAIYISLATLVSAETPVEEE